MEKQANIEYIIIACSVIVVFLAIGFILFVINQKRQQHGLKAVNDILEAQNNEEIQRIKKENEDIKRRLSEVEEICDALKRK